MPPPLPVAQLPEKTLLLTVNGPKMEKIPPPLPSPRCQHGSPRAVRAMLRPRRPGRGKLYRCRTANDRQRAGGLDSNDCQASPWSIRAAVSSTSLVLLAPAEPAIAADPPGHRCARYATVG